MLRIAFLCTRATSPSFLYYRDSLLEMNETGIAECVVVTSDIESFDPTGFDAVLLMGYDPLPEGIRQRAGDVLMVIVEPRAGQKRDLSGYDLAVYNGHEARDWFAGSTPDDFLYLVYPEVSSKMPVPDEFIKDKSECLVLGYHGNPLHLDAMVPRITGAIERLAQDRPVVLWAMYNHDICGRWRWADQKNSGFVIRHIPFSMDNYACFMANVDIGLVPQCMPVRRSRILKYLLGTLRRKYNERNADFLLRFKDTTNIGRVMVFAQYNIPVISDMTPSACSLFGGISAFSSKGWLRALRKLADDEDLRTEMGKKLNRHFQDNHTPHIQNMQLIKKITDIKNAK